MWAFCFWRFCSLFLNLSYSDNLDGNQAKSDGKETLEILSSTAFQIRVLKPMLNGCFFDVFVLKGVVVSFRSIYSIKVKQSQIVQPAT